MSIAIQRKREEWVQVGADDVRPGDVYRFIGAGGMLTTGTVLEVQGRLVQVRGWENDNVYWTPKLPEGGAKIIFWRKTDEA
jgi:hypothetical protein